ncbi:universal stress protein [Streptomyces sp. RB6PN25]|uniref:Universal stress protein n=1 Tax=Streptomyces humicola TaxID=2953240 RepID=A0ABT1Q506_9ACTN|nr:universal stress protein [Streptomyces humicola]MCQ4083870.1 universal stress protein [Streptomyces humicola]
MTRPLVVGIDGSRDSLVAGEWAAQEAALRGLPLRFVHAVPAPARDVAELPVAAAWRQTAEDVLRRAEAEIAARHPHMAMNGIQVDAFPVAALLSAAESAELLVVGARGEGGFNGLAVGSTALATASTACCPVAVVSSGPSVARDDEEETGTGAVPLEVCVGVDARHPADPPLDFAFSAAQLRRTRVRSVHAWTLPFASPWTPLAVSEEDRAVWEDQEVQGLSDVLHGWEAKYPEVPVVPDVVLLHPAHALVNASHRAGLLVLGRRSSRRAAERRLGPVAHAVLHHSHCPVIVVPHD